MHAKHQSARRHSAPPAAHARSSKTSRLWLWFVAAFALQIAGWTAWFVIASHHHIAEVPLATAR
jgi:hypothetical protein